jgi:2-iminobutanoate/2-iminopropanoate deaminase
MPLTTHNPAGVFPPYRSYDEPNVQLRVKYLGSHRPALTVLCCKLLEPQWKIEVEAVAAS